MGLKRGRAAVFAAIKTYRPDGTKEGYFYLALSCRHLSFVRKLYTPVLKEPVEKVLNI